MAFPLGGPFAAPPPWRLWPRLAGGMVKPCWSCAGSVPPLGGSSFPPGSPRCPATAAVLAPFGRIGGSKKISSPASGLTVGFSAARLWPRPAAVLATLGRMGKQEKGPVKDTHAFHPPTLLEVRPAET